MAQSLPKYALRPFLPADTPTLAAIFVAAVQELTGDDYGEAQQEAWAAVAEDEDEFGKKLAGELTLIATLQNSPVGFGSLKDNNHIDMLYVHPSVAGEGVGATLCDALEKLAGARVSWVALETRVVHFRDGAVPLQKLRDPQSALILMTHAQCKGHQAPVEQKRRVRVHAAAQMIHLRCRRLLHRQCPRGRSETSSRYGAPGRSPPRWGESSSASRTCCR